MGPYLVQKVIRVLTIEEDCRRKKGANYIMIQVNILEWPLEEEECIINKKKVLDLSRKR